MKECLSRVVEATENRGEVGLVLRPDMLCLEEEHHLWTQVGDPVSSDATDAVEREPNPVLPLVDPFAAIRR
jgi:hypothetical protein